MTDKYKTQSTSRQSLVVDDRELSRNSKSRRIIRPLIVDNPNDRSASVKIAIVHQKATSVSTFEDIASEPLSKLKAGEMSKLALDTTETLKLFQELKNLYAIHENKGVPTGTKEIVVGYENEIIQADPKRANFIKRLMEQGHSEEVWQQLVEADPDLATKLSQARVQQTRQQTLKLFLQMLTASSKTEDDWQEFFEQNTWIFGYGLNYQILKAVTSQAHYGGQTVQGSGTNKGDFLKSTQGAVKFTVLVEIKKPNTSLVTDKPYRNDSYPPSPELNGGMSQLRVNAFRWEQEGSQTSKNRDSLEGKSIFTVKPKMLLIVGHTNQLTDRAKRESFELLRRSQADLEILTFDEIYERARFIVEHNNSANG